VSCACAVEYLGGGGLLGRDGHGGPGGGLLGEDEVGAARGEAKVEREVALLQVLDGALGQVLGELVELGRQVEVARVALLVEPAPGGLGAALLDVQRADVAQDAHALLLPGLDAVLGLLDELEQLHQEREGVAVRDDRLQEEDQDSVQAN
jgi:hypothetical protein